MDAGTGGAEGGGHSTVQNTENPNDWQISAVTVFSLSKHKSPLHAKSVTNEQDRFSPLSSSHFFQKHLQEHLFSCLPKHYCNVFGYFYLLRFCPFLSHKLILRKELSKCVITSVWNPVLHVIDNQKPFLINPNTTKQSKCLVGQAHIAGARVSRNALCTKNLIKLVLLRVQYLWIL